jgi:hypothetical protein
MLLREVNFTAQNYNLAGTEKLTQVVIVHDKDHLKKTGDSPRSFPDKSPEYYYRKKRSEKINNFSKCF